MINVVDNLISFQLFLFQVEKLEKHETDEIKSLALDSKEDVFEYILSKNLLNEQELEELYKKYKSIGQVDLEEVTCYRADIPEKMANEFSLLALGFDEGVYKVAIPNPLNIAAMRSTRLFLGKPIEFLMCAQEQYSKAFDLTYHDDNKINTLIENANKVTLSMKYKELSGSDIANENTSSHISLLMDSILEDAVRMDASDIHIEAGDQCVSARFRLSGSLVEHVSLPTSLSNILLRHVIARSDGDLMEMRLPQDSSFQYMYFDDLINIRVSVLFSINGYSIVLRLLKPAKEYQNLKKTINDPGAYEAVSNFLEGLNGMILITGPTSSGKTTLLYNALMEVVKRNCKILTAEDPVEVQLPGITQVQVIPEIGLDYAEVIKTSLRQNPDAMMLGEIRDTESANMAMRAAITGVMVAATLHTKNVTGTVLRLLDFDIDLSMIASGVGLIVAARLIRTLCMKCRQETKITSEEVKDCGSSVELEQHIGTLVYAAHGCEDCRNTGYAGMTGVYEYLYFDSEIKAILGAGNYEAFQTKVFAHIKGRTLGENAIKLWLAGQTSFEEVKKLVLQ